MAVAAVVVAEVAAEAVVEIEEAVEAAVEIEAAEVVVVVAVAVAASVTMAFSDEFIFNGDPINTIKEHLWLYGSVSK